MRVDPTLSSHSRAFLRGSEDTCIERLNCFQTVLGEYSETLATVASTGPLSVLFATASEAERDGLATRMQRCILQLAAHTWWRLYHVFADWPYRLLVMVDSRVPAAAQIEVAHDLFSTPLCCLDTRFSRKLRQMYTSPVEMLECTHLRSTLIEWGVSARLTNMVQERNLALVKQATRGKAPLVERLHAAGMLTQLLASHRAHGLSDPCVVRRDELIAKGAPLEGAPRRRNRRMMRPHIAYANTMLRREAQTRRLAGQPPMSRGELSSTLHRQSSGTLHGRCLERGPSRISVQIVRPQARIWTHMPHSQTRLPCGSRHRLYC